MGYRDPQHREARVRNPNQITLSRHRGGSSHGHLRHLEQVSPELREPGELRQLADTVANQIKDQCPNVQWTDS